MARRAVFYGEIPADIVAALQRDYGAEVLVQARSLQQGMVDAFRNWTYDAAIIDVHAPKAESLARAIENQRGLPVVRVDKSQRGGSESLLKRIAAQLHWAPGVGAVFVVVTAGKGGVGKTTTAGAICEILSREEGQRVLGVDDNPQQANLVHFFFDSPVTSAPTSSLTYPEDVKRYTVTVHESLDLFPPEEYTANGGITQGSASEFWGIVGSQNYDYIVVDTSPALAVGDSSQDSFAGVPLTAPLIQLEDTFPAIFVTPFTPDEWGHTGVESTRSMLKLHGQDRWMIAVVTATDARHTLEYVPSWISDLQVPFFAIPYVRGIREDSSVSTLQKSFMRDPLKHYRPLVAAIMDLGQRRKA